VIGKLSPTIPLRAGRWRTHARVVALNAARCSTAGRRAAIMLDRSRVTGCRRAARAHRWPTSPALWAATRFPQAKRH
jgi:hypothetical protein